MTHLSLGQIQTLQTQLTSLIARLRGEIAAAMTGTPGAEAPGLTNHLQDVDDAAVASLETSLNIAAIERDMRELRAAEQALQRLSSEGYGICTDCNAEIPFDRLHASPIASRCIVCLSRVEQASNGGRPHSL